MKKLPEELFDLPADYKQFKASELQGRYITYNHISTLIEGLENFCEVDRTSTSTLGIPIPVVTFGNGSIKILAWSQMHGNESTTTKAVFDLLSFLQAFQFHSVVKEIKVKITLKIIPMLNPDGARAYTRVNANKVDLNRDAFDLSQKESRILRRIFDDFNPDFCFNLHDQRTIFSAGENNLPATISFLTPAMDTGRSITSSREKSMKVIASVNQKLQNLIPGQIGRYSDDYNINCTGDTFQTLEVPTLLFEAGHFQGDYEREKTREYVFYALFSAIAAIRSGVWENCDSKDYQKIPQNEKLFYDVILRNALIDHQVTDIAIQFKEELKGKKIEFVPVVEKMAPTLSFFGHKEYDCRESEVLTEEGKKINENDIVKKVFIKNEVLIINYVHY